MDAVLVIGTLDIILRIPGALVALRDLRTLDGAMKLPIEIPDEVVEQIAQQAAEIVVERQRAYDSPWLNSRAAAEHLCCSVSRIHDLVALRKLEPCRDGTRLLFRRADLDAYVARAP